MAALLLHKSKGMKFWSIPFSLIATTAKPMKRKAAKTQSKKTMRNLEQFLMKMILTWTKKRKSSDKKM